MDYRSAYENGIMELEKAGTSEAKLDARLLLERVCDTDHSALIAHPDRELSEKELKDILGDIAKAYENADFSRMEELAEILGDSIVPSEYSESVEGIVNAISDFDYDEAFSMLNI